jgi:hypothetical protein
MVPKGSMIAQVEGVTNAVTIEADILGELMLSGPGAGGDATASAVLGDIADIAKSRPGHQHAPALGPAGNAAWSPIGVRGCGAMRVATSYRSRSRTAPECSLRLQPGWPKTHLAGIDRSAGASGRAPSRAANGHSGNPCDDGIQCPRRGRRHQGRRLSGRRAAGDPD